MTITLDQAEDRRLFLFERATAAAPLSRRRRPARPFLDGSGISLVPGNDVDLVGLDLAIQPRLGDFGDKAGAMAEFG